MKNLINYYYGLLVREFKKINDVFLFQINEDKYEFTPFYGDINTLHKTYMILMRNNRYCHEVLVNKDKSMLTFYENKPYLLIKKKLTINSCVDINEILNYDISVFGEYKFDWKKLWSQKIDYYEYQMGQLSFKYNSLKNSFNYYVGLSETAIAILNYIDINEVNFHICHKRITENQSLDEFFNPINITIDNRVRDVAEYLKFNYINDKIAEKEVYFYLDNLNLNYTESLLFLSRMLYPSYYFDMYDQIIQEKSNEKKINFYIKKNAIYETFLKKIYSYIKTKHKIPEIEWLEN